MNRGSNIHRGVLWGGISGFLVLGVAFRLVTVLIAFLNGNSLNLSFQNLFEVLVLGSLIGIIGGISLVLTVRFLRLGGPLLIAINSVFLVLLLLAHASISKSGALLHTKGGLTMIITVVSMLIIYNALTYFFIRQSKHHKRSQS